MQSTTSYSVGSAVQPASTNVWTKEETDKLIELEKNPLFSWITIANTFHNKTAQECKDCWKKIFKQIFLPEKQIKDKTIKKWTTEEKNQLIDFKENYFHLDFDRIAIRLNKTVTQCQNQWKILNRKPNQSQITVDKIAAFVSSKQSASQDQHSVSSWTPDETTLLIALKKNHDNTFIKIATRLKKTPAECQEHWKELQTTASQSEWAAEEDSLLISLRIDKSLTWTQIAKYFTNQSSNNCRDRFNLIYKNSSSLSEIKQDLSETKQEPNLEKLIQLEQDSLTWEEIAKFFPNTTDKDCRKLWQEKVLKPYLDRKQKQEEKEKYKSCTPQQKKEMNDLIQKFPHFDWERIAIRVDKTPEQCRDHIRKTKSLKRPAEENDSGSSSKKQRTQGSNPSHSSDFSLESVPSLKDIQNSLDPILSSYTSAVTHFKEMQVIVPILADYQEDANTLNNILKIYEEIKQKLEQEECSQEIAQKISEINQVAHVCHLRTYCIELLYQYFSSYQIDPQDKEWFISQGQEFGTLYLNFLKENINEAFLREQILFKERDYYYQKSIYVFKFWEDSLQRHCDKLSSKYQDHITNLFNNINSQLELLKNDPDWLSKNSLFTKISERLQEIEIFFQNTAIIFSPFLDKLNEIESNIIARINDEITSEDFKARQTAIEKTEASLAIPVQDSTQEFDDFFNPNAFDDLFNFNT